MIQHGRWIFISNYSKLDRLKPKMTLLSLGESEIKNNRIILSHPIIDFDFIIIQFYDSTQEDDWEQDILFVPILRFVQVANYESLYEYMGAFIDNSQMLQYCFLTDHRTIVFTSKLKYVLREIYGIKF